jgi:sulfatase maturation enzyme AslB (radical SAM superfamily)
MVSSCIVNGCKNRNNWHSRVKGITFHKFPSNAAMREKWIKLCRDNFIVTPTNNTRICSKHFLIYAFVSPQAGCGNIYHRLNPESIPSIFLTRVIVPDLRGCGPGPEIEMKPLT